MESLKIKRNVLLNPGPATTTDTVKMAQVVPDICPREQEFAGLMKKLRSDLLKVVHAPEDQYTSVLFCGSGTINIDVCINSLVPEGKKILVVIMAPTAHVPWRCARCITFLIPTSSQVSSNNRT